MVFANLIRQAKHSHQHEKILFFQSSQPYLHNNHSLTPFHHFFSRKGTNDDPHPSSSPLRNFLSIDNGHYGLYYAIFNHQDPERKKRCQRPNEAILEHMINCEILLKFYYPYEYLNVSAKFFILKFNQDIYNNINQIRSMTRAFLSHLSIPSHNVSFIKIAYQNQFINSARYLSTSTPAANQITIDKFPQQVKAIKHDEEPVEQPFEATLLNTQLSSILDIYSNHSSPEELNLIYPLYQSLKRNNISLPSIDFYNVVLNSIVSRTLDSEASLLAIESKLTNLLTIYQDILQSTIKPNYETYNIILSSLLDGASSVAHLPKTNLYALDALTNKEQEFSTIGFDLFNSISSIEQLNLDQLVSKMLPIMIHNPSLISNGLLTKIVPHLAVSNQSGPYYLDVLLLSKYFAKHNIMTNNELYDFITSIYANFKDTDNDQFTVYTKLVETLVHNNFFSEASKFLDDILVDYKESLASPNKPKQADISKLISAYISAIIDTNEADLNKGFDLLVKFNKVTYIPELSVELYNNLIVKHAASYVRMEAESPAIQKSLYEKIWYLYNYMAIRRDYQATSTVELVNGGAQMHCRDVLLSLSIDRGDHERIFQLIKEILLKNHLVLDLNAFKKLLNYLYNGVVFNVNGEEPFNQYYFGLIWNLLEAQSVHYTSSTDLNNFVSEFISYMMIRNATAETNEYNIKLFLQSPVISKAINKFDLALDNIYGLIVISRTLMGYHGSDMKMYNAILKFQSKLIQQFEDTENHYIEFNEEIINFKASIKAHFASLMASLQTVERTPEIMESCKICDITAPEINESENFEFIYDLNLSYLLNVNYKVGEQKFIDLFRKGYRFNSLTWEIILNYNFLINHLERMNVQDLLTRLWMLDFDEELKLNHLQTIINFNSDKVNIQVVKFLDSHKMEALANEAYFALVKSVSDSSNLYLKEMLVKPEFFASCYKLNQTGSWIPAYLSFMNQQNHFEAVQHLVETFNLHKSDENVLVHYLTALSKRDQKKFNTVSKEVLKDNAALKRSPEMIEILVKYYISLGSPKHMAMAINTFGKFEDLSQEIKESLLYAKLVMNDADTVKIVPAKSINEYSLRLLGSDLVDMKKLYEVNKPLLSNTKRKNDLITSIITNLIKLSQGSSEDLVMTKFQAILKYFKLTGLRTFTEDQLCLVITLMKFNNSSSILNILVHKLISNNSTGSQVVNFYFMETVLSNKQKILGTLYDAFETLEDPINLYNIQEYCKSHNLRL